MVVTNPIANINYADVLSMNIGPMGTQSPSPSSQHYRGWVTGMAVAISLTTIIAIILAWALLKRRYRIVKVDSERGKGSVRSESTRSGRDTQRGSSPAGPPVELPVREAAGAEMPERGDFGVELPMRSARKTELAIVYPLKEREKLVNDVWV
jgi:hypothetical protein